MRRRLAGAAVLVAWALLQISCDGGPRTGSDDPERPDSVVLITVDTLRADHLGLYGYGRPTSPEIDRFAGQSLVFERAYAHASETRGSMASLLTGFYPHETAVYRGEALPDATTTLAEILQAAGYRTAAVVSNYVLRVGGGFEQGFAIFDDEMTGRERVREVHERAASGTTDRALEILDELEAGPFLLWVHYQDPHGPYTPPEEHLAPFSEADRSPRPLPVRDSLRGEGGIPSYQRLGELRDYHDYVDRYDGEIRYADAEIGRLLSEIRGRAWYPNALLVFTSDHGEGLGEQNQYFAHMEYLNDALTRVPLILHWRDRLHGRRRDPVQLVDLLPTILGLLGLDGAPALRGRDLLAGATEPRAVLQETIRTDRWPALRTGVVWDGHRLTRAIPEGRLELFDLEGRQPDGDLSGEPGQQARLSDLVGRLKELRREDRLGVRGRMRAEPVSPAERERLEALGYVQ